MSYLKQQTRKSVFALGAIAFVAVGSPTHAMEPGYWNFQLYGGWYAAGDLQKLNDIDGSLGDTMEALGLEPGDDLTFGVRLGQRVADTWGWETSLGYFDVDEAAERLEDRSGIDISLLLFDLSFMYYPGGGNFFLYGGPGIAGTNLDIDHNGVQVADESSTELSGNVGLGYFFDVGESAFIRLDAKIRYFEGDYYEAAPDSEFTAALGWDF
ncbi:MAG: outer membrane beta-barrel protein [Pseudomonadota bacterium]|nr:outer membrane beta-barrel protein [Pseudomonadota bacterium]